MYIYTFWSRDSHRDRVIKYLNFEPNVGVHSCLTPSPNVRLILILDPQAILADVFYGRPLLTVIDTINIIVEIIKIDHININTGTTLLLKTIIS